MKSILNLFRPTQAEVAIREDISRGREKPKQSTVLPGRQSTPSTITPSTVGGSELDQLRASVGGYGFHAYSSHCQNGTRSKKSSATTVKRTSRCSATWSIPTENCNHSSEKPGSNYLLHIAAQAQLGPLPDMVEDSTPEGRNRSSIT
jgi:hypothetical protein